MDCEQVRDRFSSLWEKELALSEEEIITEHLSSCQACQKEFKRFGRTMEWLGSVEEVEVPEGFLPELYKKIEIRKAAPLAEKSKGKWLIFPVSFKLPAQAIAMASMVFLVLFLARMTPMEVSPKKGPDQISSPPSEASQEVKKEEAPAPKSEGMASPQVESAGTAKEKIPASPSDQFEGGAVSEERSVLGSKPSQEITLKMTDREKTIFQLEEWVKYFQGEMVAEGKDRFMVSLPTGSLPEFEERLEEMSLSKGIDQEKVKNRILRSSRAAPGFEREKEPERMRSSEKVSPDREGRTVVLIHLVSE